MTDGTRLLVWAEANQGELIADAAGVAGLEVVAVGVRREAVASELAEAFGAEAVSDLRLQLQRRDLDVVWLATPERIEADLRRGLRETGMRRFACDPRPIVVSEVAANPDDAMTAMFVPRFRDSPGYRAALGAVEEFGAPEAVGIECMGGASQGLLLARLFDAMDALVALCGSPERIEATFAGPLKRVPDAWEELHGHLSVNLRFAENRCAALVVSDRVGSWHRRVSLLGARGRLVVTDLGYTWTGPDGVVVDAEELEPRSVGVLVGEQIARLLREQPAAAGPPVDSAQVLTLCETTRLSARTGGGEAPQNLVEVLRRV